MSRRLLIFFYSGVLINTGSSYQYNSLKKELCRYGIDTIDHLVITHDDEDHNGNLHNLDKVFRIKDVIEKGHDFYYRNLNFQYLKMDESDNDNDNSLVYLLDVSGCLPEIYQKHVNGSSSDGTVRCMSMY